MALSAIEIEMREVLKKIRNFVRGHDRAVIIALLLAFVPFPIASLFSLVISAFNILLLLLHKLGRREIFPVALAVIVATSSIFLFFFYLIEIPREFFKGLLSESVSVIIDFFNKFRQGIHGSEII